MTPQLSARLLVWRASHHLSRSQAAKLLGVPLRTLESWEQGLRQPRTVLTLRALDSILGPIDEKNAPERR